MEQDIGTTPPASAGDAGVLEATPPGYEPGAGTSDADQDREADQSDGDPLETGDGASGPDTTEVEYGGQKYTVPKALEAAIMKDADYTQKTQDLAETARQREQQFAEREQRIAQAHQAGQLLQQGRATLAALDMRLQEFQNINWNAAAAQDPGATQQAFFQFQQLRDQRQGVANQLTAAEQQYHSQSEHQAVERVRAAVSKWSPGEAQEVSETGQKVYGITAQHMALFGSHPVLLDVLRDAVLHQKAMKSAAAVTKPAPKATLPPPVAVLPQGKNPSTKSINDPSVGVDDWMQRRNEQLKRSSRRR